MSVYATIILTVVVVGLYGIAQYFILRYKIFPKEKVCHHCG